jgi:hypothetical protein
MQATHRDTPPEDVFSVAAGLLARGSSLLSCLPGGLAPSDIYGQQLAAYSCGGSPGFAMRLTGFPLSSRFCNSGDRDY